ncbi:hypothetical protein HMPREF0091_10041 [Fannyhessea vaginae DSM 15829]|uniref:Uncharacterized protein n=1 Tax=Fannyhessea vaginae DSM 15829 TaxID=525256 RepID=F1T573_9ACTN|nr:hypothetical protein HMPREF0091_10041 [Fannyhessea vaginae DSM 15829]
MSLFFEYTVRELTIKALQSAKLMYRHLYQHKISLTEDAQASYNSYVYGRVLPADGYRVLQRIKQYFYQKRNERTLKSIYSYASNLK